MFACFLLLGAVVSCCLVTALSTAERHAASIIYDFSIGADFKQFAYGHSVPRTLTPDTIPYSEFIAASVSSISINAGNVE